MNKEDHRLQVRLEFKGINNTTIQNGYLLILTPKNRQEKFIREKRKY